MKKRVLSVIISGILIFSGLSGINVSAKDVAPPKGEEIFRCDMSEKEILDAADYWYDLSDEWHPRYDFNDIEYDSIDEDILDDIINRTREDIQLSDNETAVIDDFNELVVLTNHIGTQLTLSMIHYYADVNDEEKATEQRSMNEVAVNLIDSSSILLRDMLGSQYGDIIKEQINDEDVVQDLLDYEDMTPRQKELTKQLTDLRMQYDSVMQSLETTINGEKYNVIDINGEYENGELSYDDYLKKYYAWQENFNDDVCQIYIRIVKILNELARSDGYDNYAQEGYDNYCRDYTTEDIKVVYEDVQKYIVPLFKKLSGAKGYSRALDNMALNQEEKLDRVEKIIAKIDPGLVMAWDNLRRAHTCDLEVSEGKSQQGFTTYLYSYGTPYIFDAPYQSFEDINTVIHEFGHYNTYLHAQDDCLFEEDNLDVAEIQSQGLEVLAMDYYGELFGEENANDAKISKLTSLLNSVIDGCIYDEFQVAVFESEEELTTEKLNTMFHDIAVKYGRTYEAGAKEDYTWIYVTHTFHSPMYYIAYATSALAALDILAMSVDNRQAAVDCYMTISNFGMDLKFREAIDETGLPDIFEEGNIEDIAIAVEDYIGPVQSKVDIVMNIAKANLAWSIFSFVAMVVAFIIMGANFRRLKKAQIGD